MSFLNKAIKEWELGDTVSTEALVEIINNKAYNKTLDSLGDTPVGMSVPTQTETSVASSSAACALDDNRILVIQTYSGNLRGRISTRAGMTITTGTSYAIKTGVAYAPSIVKIDTDKALIVCGNASSRAETIAVTTVGDVIVAGSVVEIEAAQGDNISFTEIGTDTAVVAYRSGGNQGKAAVLSVTGTTVTVGTLFSFSTGNLSYTQIQKVTPSTCLVTYTDNENLSYGTAVILSVSGTTITSGTDYVYNETTSYQDTIAVLDSKRVLALYRDPGNSFFSVAQVLSVSGITITGNTAYTYLDESITLLAPMAFRPNTVFVAYRSYIGGSPYDLWYMVLSIEGTVVTLSQPGVKSYETAAQLDWISSFKMTDEGIVGVPFNDSGTHNEYIQLFNLSTRVNRTYGIAQKGGTAGETVPIHLI